MLLTWRALVLQGIVAERHWTCGIGALEWSCVASVQVAATASTARLCCATSASRLKLPLLMPTSSSSRCAPSPEAASAAGFRSPESSPGLLCSSCPSWEALEAADCSDWPELDQREGALPSASENPVCMPSTISMCCWAIWDWACKGRGRWAACGEGMQCDCEQHTAAPAELRACRRSSARHATLMGGCHVGMVGRQCSMRRLPAHLPHAQDGFRRMHAQHVGCKHDWGPHKPRGGTQTRERPRMRHRPD